MVVKVWRHAIRLANPQQVIVRLDDRIAGGNKRRALALNGDDQKRLDASYGDAFCICSHSGITPTVPENTVILTGSKDGRVVAIPTARCQVFCRDPLCHQELTMFGKER